MIEGANVGAEMSKLAKEQRPIEVKKKRLERMKENQEITAVWNETGILPKLLQDVDPINMTQRVKAITGDEIEILMDYYEQHYMFETSETGKKYRVARPMTHFISFLYKHGYVDRHNAGQISTWKKSGQEDLESAAYYCYTVFENNNLSGGSKGEIVARMADMALRRNDPLYKEQPITINAIGEDPMAALSTEKIQEMIESNQKNVNVKIDKKNAIDIPKEDD